MTTFMENLVNVMGRVSDLVQNVFVYDVSKHRLCYQWRWAIVDLNYILFATSDLIVTGI